MIWWNWLAVAWLGLGAITLLTLECLSRESGDPEPTLKQCGEIIRRMHETGVYHADLQIRNIHSASG